MPMQSEYSCGDLNRAAKLDARPEIPEGILDERPGWDWKNDDYVHASNSSAAASSARASFALARCPIVKM
jgi:hypothetical protein